MKLKEKLTELGYHFSEGLWIAELSGFRVFVTETEDGIQIAKMPDDAEESSLIIRFNRFDSSIFALLESWAVYA